MDLTGPTDVDVNNNQGRMMQLALDKHAGRRPMHLESAFYGGGDVRNTIFSILICLIDALIRSRLLTSRSPHHRAISDITISQRMTDPDPHGLFLSNR